MAFKFKCSPPKIIYKCEAHYSAENAGLGTRCYLNATVMIAAAFLKPEMNFISEQTAKSDGTPPTTAHCHSTEETERKKNLKHNIQRSNNTLELKGGETIFQYNSCFSRTFDFFSYLPCIFHDWKSGQSFSRFFRFSSMTGNPEK